MARTMKLRVAVPSDGREGSLFRSLPGVVVAVALAVMGLNRVNAGSPALTFEHDIRPILKAECFQCHGEGEKLKGDLDLRLRQLIVIGGEDGTALVPGKPEKSELFVEVRDGKMPKGEKKLSKAQIETIRKWIAGGAKTARIEPAVPPKPGEFTSEEREY